MPVHGTEFRARERLDGRCLVTTRKADPKTELTWFVYSDLDGTKAWCETEGEARALAEEWGEDEDMRGVIYVMRLVAVVS